MLYKKQKKLKVYFDYYVRLNVGTVHHAEAQFDFDTLSGENRLNNNDWHLICITCIVKRGSVWVRAFALVPP